MNAIARIHEIQRQFSSVRQALRPQGFDDHLHRATTAAPGTGTNTTVAAGTFNWAPGHAAPNGSGIGAAGAHQTPSNTNPSTSVGVGALGLREFPRLDAPPAQLEIPAHVDLPDRAHEWLGEIEAAAQRHQVDPALFTALVWSESAFRADAESHAGAIGLAQLMPGTAAQMGLDPHEPLQNLEGGARFLAAQLNRFGEPELALAAYNAGPARVARVGGIPNITETQNYVEIVMRRYHALQGEDHSE